MTSIQRYNSSPEMPSTSSGLHHKSPRRVASFNTKNQKKPRVTHDISIVSDDEDGGVFPSVCSNSKQIPGKGSAKKNSSKRDLTTVDFDVDDSQNSSKRAKTTKKTPSKSPGRKEYVPRHR